MPKPNKYQGNGSLKPEGTHEGSYVMNKGQMVPDFEATDSAIERGLNAYKAYRKENRMFVRMIARIMLVIVCVCFALALLTGCAVNVITMPDATIVIDGELVTQQVIKQATE